MHTPCQTQISFRFRNLFREQICASCNFFRACGVENRPCRGGIRDFLYAEVGVGS